MPTHRNRRFLWLTMLLLLITCPTIILILRLADVDMILVARTGAEHTASSLTYRLCDRQTSFPANTHFQNGSCSVIERRRHSQENNAEVVGARNQAKGTEGGVENTRHGVIIAVLSLAAFLVLLGFLALAVLSCVSQKNNPGKTALKQMTSRAAAKQARQTHCKNSLRDSHIRPNLDLRQVMPRELAKSRDGKKALHDVEVGREKSLFQSSDGRVGRSGGVSLPQIIRTSPSHSEDISVGQSQRDYAFISLPDVTVPCQISTDAIIEAGDIGTKDAKASKSTRFRSEGPTGAVSSAVIDLGELGREDDSVRQSWSSMMSGTTRVVSRSNEMELRVDMIYESDTPVCRRIPTIVEINRVNSIGNGAGFVAGDRRALGVVGWGWGWSK